MTFESKGEIPGTKPGTTRPDTSANIYESMLLSDAWQDLTAPQVRLYLVCKAQFYGKAKPKDYGSKAFYMNMDLWLGTYHLYKSNNRAGFYRDMDELIAHGFITCLSNGYSTKSRSVYEFSDQWQSFGKGAIPIPSTIRERMSNRERKKDRKAEEGGGVAV
jgi:hypothetical protein